MWSFSARACRVLFLAKLLLCCAALVVEVGTGDESATLGRGSAGSFGAGRHLGGSDAGGSAGAERDEVAAGSSGAVGTAGVGVLRTLDFKLSPGVASVGEEVARFAAPPCLDVLFQRVPVDQMFRSIEANATRVSEDAHPCASVL